MAGLAYPRRDRLVGATLALAIQAGLIALLIFSHAPWAPPEKIARELTFVLPRLRPVAPPPAPARPGTPSRAPAAPLPLPPQVLPMPDSTVPAPPSQEILRNLGQSLFGCAPENWSSLTPQQRSHCSRPGEGVAIQQAPPLLVAPDHVKDKALWQEQWAEDHWMPALCGDPTCLMDQLHTEKERAKKARQKIADDKAAALQEPKRPLPETIGVHPK